MSERPPKPEPPQVEYCREDCGKGPPFIGLLVFSLIAALAIVAVIAKGAELRRIRCLDGDTIVADISLGFDVVLAQQTIRIHNYDAWETSYRRQTIEYATDELAKGALAKAALEKLLTGKVTVLEVAGRDPYGRRLLEVYADGVNVGETLRAQGHERTEKRLSALKNN